MLLPPSYDIGTLLFLNIEDMCAMTESDITVTGLQTVWPGTDLIDILAKIKLSY